MSESIYIIGVLPWASKSCSIRRSEILVTGAYCCVVARVINSLDLDLERGYESLRVRDD